MARPTKQSIFDPFIHKDATQKRVYASMEGEKVKMVLSCHLHGETIQKCVKFSWNRLISDLQEMENWLDIKHEICYIFNNWSCSVRPNYNYNRIWIISRHTRGRPLALWELWLWAFVLGNLLWFVIRSNTHERSLPFAVWHTFGISKERRCRVGMRPITGITDFDKSPRIHSKYIPTNSAGQGLLPIRLDLTAEPIMDGLRMALQAWSVGGHGENLVQFDRLVRHDSRGVCCSWLPSKGRQFNFTQPAEKRVRCARTA